MVKRKLVDFRGTLPTVVVRKKVLPGQTRTIVSGYLGPGIESDIRADAPEKTFEAETAMKWVSGGMFTNDLLAATSRSHDLDSLPFLLSHRVVNWMTCGEIHDDNAKYVSDIEL